MCCRHVGLLALGLLFVWYGAAVAAPAIPDGKEPWLVMFKKGVDGDKLWEHLCPKVTIGNDPTFAVSQEDKSNIIINSLDSTPFSSALNCTARFNSLLNGVAGTFTPKQIDQIKAMYKNRIDYVISDKMVRVDVPQEMHDAAAYRRHLLSTQEDATWGLDLIDQGKLPLDNMYHYTYNGTGVHVYILDTGIKTNHAEFIDKETGLSRAHHGFDAVSGTNSSEDCHGHGTHVAAIVGGNRFGVAKNVTLHAVRVLTCDGTAQLSSLVKGLEWVSKNHIKPAVVHMSIEGGFSSIINKAVDQLIKVKHVHVVVSSGNSGKDACRFSPASSPDAVTVAAVDQTISRWSYANWGACVDVFAPGVSILSAVSATDESTALKTGTSMAAPFVTGVVAAYLEAHPGASAAEVQQKLYQTSIRGAVGDDPNGYATMWPGTQQKNQLADISSTPNRLLMNNLTAQAQLYPGQLQVSMESTPLDIAVVLNQQPEADVAVSISVPNGWDGNPIADVYPSQLLFTPDTWNANQTFALHPKPVCDGDYYITLNFQGQDDYFPAIHTVHVADNRTRSGDTAAMARQITDLPFNDTGDTSAFQDNYGCQVTDQAPDIVYSYTASDDVDATVSTCGSGFDTKLIVSTNLSDAATYLCNDDDRNCASNTACSKLDVSFKAGITYYIVIDGYNGASGEYVLTVTCPKCVAKNSNSIKDTNVQMSTWQGSVFTNQIPGATTPATSIGEMSDNSAAAIIILNPGTVNGRHTMAGPEVASSPSAPNKRLAGASTVNVAAAEAAPTTTETGSVGLSHSASTNKGPVTGSNGVETSAQLSLGDIPDMKASKPASAQQPDEAALWTPVEDTCSPDGTICSRATADVAQ